MSGVHKSLECDGDPIENPEYEEGTTLKVAFRNTGSGWERDDSLTEDLPIFGMLMIESPEYVVRKYSDLAGVVVDYKPCFDFALNGQSTNLTMGYKGDFCINTVNLAPTFTDLNGDGQPEVIVSDPVDKTRLWVDNLFYDGYPYFWATDREVATLAVSHVWAREGGAWVRTPEFDPPFNHAVPAHEDPGDLTGPKPDSFNGDAGVRFADFNRDGYTDMVWAIPENPETAGMPSEPVGVLLNRGSGDGTAYSAWCSSRDLDVDLDSDGNLDGEVDVCPHASRYEPPPGQRFARLSSINPYLTTETTGLHLADLNGDGWIDLLRADEAGECCDWVGLMKAWLHDPSSDPVWVEDPRFEPPITTTGSFDALGWAYFGPGVRLIDLNLDGVVDFSQGVLGSGANINRTATSLSSLPDLLREYRNNQGVTVQFTYKPRVIDQSSPLEGPATTEGTAAWDAALHGEEPSAESIVGGPPHPVVATVEVDGPNQDSATTSYDYAHPRYDPARRSSLGFRLVEKTRPDDSTVRHYFYQKHGRAGRTSTLLVKDGGSEVFRREEDWELPTQLIPGSIDHDEVHVGRLAEVRSANQYSGEPGAGHTRTFSYDDAHGYNFVSQIDESRPTGDLFTLFVPKPPDVANWLVRLVQQRTEQASDVGTPPVLRRSTSAYTAQGRVSSRTDYVRRRDESDTATTAETTFLYDDYGNLTQRTDANGYTTHFCYDGDGDWCPSFTNPVQDSHSVLVGIQDPLGKVTSLTPDSVTGIATQIDSEYEDEPTIRRALDPFGRVEDEYVTPLGGNEFLRTATVYHDDVTPPYAERLDYTAGAGSESIRSAVVSDGFGGVWKTIEENPAEAANPYRSVAVYRDPTGPLGALLRETFPIPCADITCSALKGDEETPAIETTADALGRPIRVDTPDGLSILDYTYADRTQPAGPGTGGRFDSVLTKNGKGDLTERILDGARAVWVDECSNPVDPTTTSLTGVTCDTPDRTFYTYEPTGEVSTVYDAVAVVTGGFNNPAHYLRYHYDTLGRVRRIDDADGGTSFTDYDGVGNVAWTKNARTKETSFGYDALGRLTSIDYPDSEKDVTLSYRANERQRERERANDWSYAKTFDYDGLGRLERKTFDVGGYTMLLDFAYDELDRTTTIVYPDNETVVQYEYDGAYLDKVCEVQSEADDCGHTDAVSYIGEVLYDDLGRRAEVHAPPGVRTFDYSPDTYRVTDDDFAGIAPDSYTRNIDYTLYDEIGNIRTVAASTSTSAVDFSAVYTYDQRNRVDSWGPPQGPLAHFTYDSLGNLIGHGVPSPGGTNQLFNDQIKPHAVTESTASGSTYTYDYDDDGNLYSEAGPSGTTYLTFDSQNRLVCRGTTQGGCDKLQVDYDAEGNRLRTRTTDTGPVELIYAGELFQRNVASGDNSFQILAFGEQIAFKKKEGSLRTAPAGWALPLRFELPPPLTWGVLVAVGLGAGWLLLVRRGWAETERHEPVGAALCLLLAVAVALPPFPARGGGGGAPGAMLRYWLITDHLGSGVVWLTKTGAPYRETVYTPFGKIHAQDSTGIRPPWLFAGHRRLAFSGGYVYMKARWYNPDTGTFLSVDPVVADAGDPQSFNAYSYARNNPVSFTDPTGMSPYDSIFPCGTGCTMLGPGGFFSSGYLSNNASFTVTETNASGVTLSTQTADQVAGNYPGWVDAYGAGNVNFVVGGGVQVIGANPGGGFSLPGGGGGVGVGTPQRGVQYADSGNLATAAVPAASPGFETPDDTGSYDQGAHRGRSGGLVGEVGDAVRDRDLPHFIHGLTALVGALSPMAFGLSEIAIGVWLWKVPPLSIGLIGLGASHVYLGYQILRSPDVRGKPEE